MTDVTDKYRAELSKFLDQDRMAAYLGVRPQTLCNWRTNHKGPPYVKLGWMVFYPLEEAEQFRKRYRHPWPEKRKAARV